jgi:hypothetical protein
MTIGVYCNPDLVCRGSISAVNCTLSRARYFDAVERLPDQEDGQKKTR